MNSAKLDNQLNLALDVSEEERSKTFDLNVGFNEEDKTWELIVKFSGDLEAVRQRISESIRIVELLNGFAIVTIPESRINV